MQKLLESAKYCKAKLPGDPEEPNTPTLRRYSNVASVKGAFKSSFGDFPSMRRASDCVEMKSAPNNQSTLSGGVFNPTPLLPPSCPPPPPPMKQQDDENNNMRLNHYANPVLDIISISNDSICPDIHEHIEEMNISDNITPDDPEDPDPECRNWLLKDRGPSLRSSTLTASSASILNLNETIGKKRSRFWKECYWTAERRGSISRGKAPTLSRGLVKSHSLGNCLESVSSTKFQNYVNEWEAIKSKSTPVSARRGSGNPDQTTCCCCCKNGKKTNAAHSSKPYDQNGIKTNNNTSHKLNPISMAQVHPAQQVRFSDIALEGVERELRDKENQRSMSITSEDHELNNFDCWNRASMRSNFSMRSSKSSQGKRGRKTWKTKLLKAWSLDDVLLWLQSIGLDNVASILIGYDITGLDVEAWDCDALSDLGIVDLQLQLHLLNQLEMVKSAQYGKRRQSRPSSSTPTCSLYDVIKSFGNCQILTIECCLSSRDMTVAETKHNLLVITRVKNYAPFMIGDGILEVNGLLALKMVALDLTIIISESKGKIMNLVVVREYGEDEYLEEIADSLSTSGSSGIGLAQTPINYYYRNNFSRL